MRHFTLRATVLGGQLAYIGVGGSIDGQINPDLEVRPGEQIRLTLVGDAAALLPGVVDAHSGLPHQVDAQHAADMIFTAPSSPGSYLYVCSVPGQGQAGMEGRLVVQTA